MKEGPAAAAPHGGMDASELEGACEDVACGFLVKVSLIFFWTGGASPWDDMAEKEVQSHASKFEGVCVARYKSPDAMRTLAKPRCDQPGSRCEYKVRTYSGCQSCS